MKYIKNFNLFESLGVETSIYQLAKDILPELIKNKFYHIENYKGFFVNVDIFISDDIKKYPLLKDAKGFVEFKGKINETNTFAIVLSSPDIETLTHELKHIDSRIMKNNKMRNLEKIYHASAQIINNINILSEEKLDTLKYILYYINKEEFEAHYHSLYVEIEQYINERNITDPIEIRRAVDDHLKRSNLYITIKSIHDNGFDIRNTFDSNRELLMFIKSLRENIKNITNGIISVPRSFRYLINKIVSLFHDRKIPEDDNKFIDQLNRLIVDTANIEYKKIHRLYSIFI